MACAADLATRNAAYRALIQTVGISTEHKADLARRGLSGPEAASARYGSVSVNSRHDIATLVQSDTGLTDEEILSVPGFGRDDLGRLAVLGAAGLIIPVTDKDGLISGCQIRPDKPRLEKDKNGVEKVVGKYVWLTSSTVDGPARFRSLTFRPSMRPRNRSTS